MKRGRMIKVWRFSVFLFSFCSDHLIHVITLSSLFSIKSDFPR